jgi:hypothetical protein
MCKAAVMQGGEADRPGWFSFRIVHSEFSNFESLLQDSSIFSFPGLFCPFFSVDPGGPVLSGRGRIVGLTFSNDEKGEYVVGYLGI